MVVRPLLADNHTGPGNPDLAQEGHIGPLRLRSTLLVGAIGWAPLLIFSPEVAVRRLGAPLAALHSAAACRALDPRLAPDANPRRPSHIASAARTSVGHLLSSAPPRRRPASHSTSACLRTQDSAPPWRCPPPREESPSGRADLTRRLRRPGWATAAGGSSGQEDGFFGVVRLGFHGAPEPPARAAFGVLSKKPAENTWHCCKVIMVLVIKFNSCQRLKKFS
jgi:hypothetical protein